jgi:serine/threonine protein kinase
MTGRRLLHYEVVEKLGEGGMGVVYRAHDSHLDRFVAIKVIPPEKVADPSRKTRFVQEAKAASALTTPTSSRFMTSPATPARTSSLWSVSPERRSAS